MQPAQFWSNAQPGAQYPVNQQARSVHQTITEATIGCLHVIRCADFRSVTMSSLSVEHIYNPGLSSMSFQHWQAIQNISIGSFNISYLNTYEISATTISSNTVYVQSLVNPDLSNMSYIHWQAIQNYEIPHVAFYRTLSASAPADNTKTTVSFDTVGISNDSFATLSGTRIYATQNATFNVDYTYQFFNQGGGGSGDLVSVWIAKDGTNVPYSASQIHVPTNGRDVSYSGGMYIRMLSGQYIELCWSTDNSSAIYAHTQGATASIPAVPSVKCEIHKLR